MSRLQDLLHSITAVIIRYHDAHASEKLIVESDATLIPKKSRELSPSLLNREDFEEYLKSLIRSCTVGYETRKLLLNYLTHEIVFIKSMLERKQPFTEEELYQFKQQISQMFIDLKQLLLTNKTALYKVSHSHLERDTAPAISISGLKNDSYFGNKYCFSGDLINELLGRFHFSSESSNEELRAFAEDICSDHQNSLLVPELTLSCHAHVALLEEEKIKVDELTVQNNSLMLEAAAKQSELEQALVRIQALEKQLLEQTSKEKIIAEVETQTDDSFIPPQRPIAISPLFGMLYGTTLFPAQKFPQAKPVSSVEELTNLSPQ